MVIGCRLGVGVWKPFFRSFMMSISNSSMVINLLFIIKERLWALRTSWWLLWKSTGPALWSFDPKKSAFAMNSFSESWNNLRLILISLSTGRNGSLTYFASLACRRRLFPREEQAIKIKKQLKKGKQAY